MTRDYDTTEPLEGRRPSLAGGLLVVASGTWGHPATPDPLAQADGNSPTRTCPGAQARLLTTEPDGVATYILLTTYPLPLHKRLDPGTSLELIGLDHDAE